MTKNDLAAALQKLQQEIEDLKSVRDIEELQQQYVRDLADRNWSRVADAYTDDARCDIRQHGVHKGKEAILGMFKTDLEDVVKSRDAYVLSSPSITVSGDTAYGEWIWHRFQSEFRTAFGMMRIWGPWSEGIYKCHYARINGEWKIKDLWFRVIRPDSDDELAALPTNGVIGAGILDREPVRD